MPARKVVNNLPILNRTLAHWDKVEAALGVTVTLPDGTTKADASGLATRVQNVETSLIADRNAVSRGQGARNASRAAAHNAAKKIRKSLRGLAGNVPEVLGLPELPSVTTAPATLLARYADIDNVWARVDALPASSVPAARLPLKIPLKEGNVEVSISQKDFHARIDAFRADVATLAEAEDAVSVGLGARDDLHGEAAELVKSYGGVARSLLADDHPLLKTIPALTV